jgi:hypothetical protein
MGEPGIYRIVSPVRTLSPGLSDFHIMTGSNIIGTDLNISTGQRIKYRLFLYKTEKNDPGPIGRAKKYS